MSQRTQKSDWQRMNIALAMTVVAVLLAGVLYFARAILIPITLAVFLTYILTPVVNVLHRRGLGRTLSVAVVVGASVLLVGFTGWVVAVQMAGLTQSLPGKTQNLKAKIEGVKEWVAARSDDRLTQMINDLSAAIQQPMNADEPKPTDENSPPPVNTVVIDRRQPSWIANVQGYANPAVEAVGQLAFGFVLVIFMLLQKEDLRNRMLRLIGHGRVTTSTKAIDDGSQRISRYLFAQLLLNGTFGIIIAAGLLALGVSHALLWGLLAFIMRYAPYVGTWVGLLLPTAFTVAMSDNWWQPMGVVALYMAVEVVYNNVLEPRFYSSTLGLSPVAQLVAAAFWSFMWGPIGLILSGPLTMCLLVLGRYAPQFEFLDVLLGDEPVLKPPVAYYQRLSARDQDEATSIIFAEAETHTPAELYDKVVIPALALARRDVDRGNLSDEELTFMLRATQEITEEVAEAKKDSTPPATKTATPDSRVRVLACPARDDLDRVGAELLSRLLDPAKWEVEVVAVATLASEILEQIEVMVPSVVVISAIPPGGLAHTRYLLKRIHARFPGLHVVVGRWGPVVDGESQQFRDVGADNVANTITETLSHLTAWVSVLPTTQKAARSAAESIPRAVGTRRALK